MEEFAVEVYVLQHFINIRNNFSANLRRHLGMNMEWGEPNPGVFLIYSRKINVRYPCMLQGRNKATVFINAACVIYKFTVKEHRRYLEEHLGCMCFYYEIKSVVITCFCFCFLCCYFFVFVFE